MAEKLKPMTTADWIDYAAREIEKLKWFESAKAFAETLRDREKEMEKATRERDQAYKDRDAALAEIATKQKKYEGDIKAALADLERVTTEKAAASAKAQAEAEAKLATTHAQIDKARQVLELAEAQRDAYREEAAHEVAGITARLEAMRAEERDAKSRFAGVVAALKG
jgi:DNA repair exonuclease SbcCD ATPase subunit